MKGIRKVQQAKVWGLHMGEHVAGRIRRFLAIGDKPPCGDCDEDTPRIGLGRWVGQAIVLAAAYVWAGGALIAGILREAQASRADKVKWVALGAVFITAGVGTHIWGRIRFPLPPRLDRFRGIVKILGTALWAAAIAVALWLTFRYGFQEVAD